MSFIPRFPTDATILLNPDDDITCHQLHYSAPRRSSRCFKRIESQPVVPLFIPTQQPHNSISPQFRSIPLSIFTISLAYSNPSTPLPLISSRAGSK
ncbi:hypothetical protein BDV93DRAFT_525833 [Ceratobasidium sp. AG-I]|nr:hypothetical protein BDV93DRAFT_525833 [Ceratobasidium sp. AG-I]